MTRRFVIIFFVVFLHYVPQILLWTTEEGRYCDHWGPRHVAWILLGAIAITAAVVGVDGLVRRGRKGTGTFFGRRCFRWSQSPTGRKMSQSPAASDRSGAVRLWEHAGVLAAVSGVLAAMPGVSECYPLAIDVVWIVALAVVAASLFWRRSRLTHLAAVGCLVFSPLVPILLVQMLFWSRWDEHPEPLVLPKAAAQSEDAGPVVLVVFDEWSWPRSTRDGAFLDEYKSLRQLAALSTVYRQAVSPHRDTMQSMPRLLYQTDDEMVVRGGQAFFQDGDGGQSTPERPSLFTLAREHGCRTYLLGWFHPYRRLLGSQVDVCRTYFPTDDQGPIEQVAGELLENARYWTDPLSRRIAAPVLDRAEGRNWHRMGVGYREDVRDLLARCPASSFIVCHVPSPHAPYVFDAGGDYRGPAAGMDDVAAYREQLAYVDTLVGQIIDVLRHNGRFDRATLVLTSDHGWRFDPDPAFQREPNWDRRVPLVVKLPGQMTGRVVDEPIVTNRLRSLMERALAE